MNLNKILYSCGQAFSYWQIIIFVESSRSSKKNGKIQYLVRFVLTRFSSSAFLSSISSFFHPLFKFPLLKKISIYNRKAYQKSDLKSKDVARFITVGGRFRFLLPLITWRLEMEVYYQAKVGSFCDSARVVRDSLEFCRKVCENCSLWFAFVIYLKK